LEALLFPRLFGSARLRRELQYGCLLAFGQAGEKHNLSIGELQRIVVGHRFFVNLPEDRCPVLRLYSHRKPRFDERSDAPVRVAHLAGECQFRARKNTDGSVEIGHRSEASGAGAKILRHQLVADFRGARAYTV
jgi:hypothetical protein